MTASAPRIAIIGAGIAGLACARALAAAGAAPRLFDKGRAPGGRVATRRATDPVSGAALQFDHGAQYATARDPRFAALLRQAGAVPWPAAGDPAEDAAQRLVGVPGMSALPRALAAGLGLALSRHVTAIAGRPGAWMVRHLDAGLVRPGRPLPEGAAAEEEEGPFDAVLVTLPAPQALPLVAPHLAPEEAGRLEAVRIAPCWTVLAGFAPGVRLALPDTIRPGDGGILGWAARDSARPGRAPDAAEAWVIQAGPAWSRAQLEARPEAVIPALLAALAARLPAGASPLTAPSFAAAHRWRFALVEAPLGAPCLWDPARRIGLAGDWCLRGRVESAWESGTALAAALLPG